MELISKPSKVRALGNVVELKSGEKYLTNHSIVEDSDEQESINYNVVVMSNAGSPVTFISTVSGLKQGVSSEVIFTMKEQDSNVPCSGAELKYYVNGVLTDTKTTNNNGQCTFSIPTSNFGSVELKVEFLGNVDYSKKTYNTSVVIQRRVNYRSMWVRETDGSNYIYHFEIHCRTNDTDEPVEGVNIKVYYDGHDDYIKTGTTGDDGIFKDSQIFMDHHPSSVTYEISKNDHYFEWSG